MIAQVGEMYSWATKEYMLNEMSLDQIILYYRHGWEARELKARVFWGVLGEIIGGKDQDGTIEKSGINGLKRFKELHPEGRTENGAWSVSK